MVVARHTSQPDRLVEWVQKTPDYNRVVNSTDGGWESNQVVSNHSQEQIECCPSIFKIPHIPVVLLNSSHFLCLTCFLKFFSLNHQREARTVEGDLQVSCAMCRQLFTIDMCKPIEEPSDLKSIPPESLRGFFSNVRLRCSNIGCDFIANIFDLRHHQIFTCPKRALPCPAMDCRELFPADQIIDHFTHCRKRLIWCKECQCSVSAAAEPEHNCLEHLKWMVNSFRERYRHYNWSFPPEWI